MGSHRSTAIKTFLADSVLETGMCNGLYARGQFKKIEYKIM